MSVAPLMPGHLLEDRYEIVRVLGHGGFGIAYEGIDRLRGDHVALKELAPDGSVRGPDGFLDLHTGGLTRQILRNRFAEEASRLARLRVPGVLPIRGTFGANGTVYFATDFVPNAETLERRLVQEGTFSVEDAEALLLALLRILQPVHKAGILHRDIKPSNVLITPDFVVYLIDFGAAREFLVDSQSTQTVMYTPGYAPPEQLSERARRGPATDLYAVAATIYTALAGAPPADAAERMAGQAMVPIQECRIDVGEGLARVLAQALALPVADRPQSASEMEAMLEGVDESAPVSNLEYLDDLLVRTQNLRFEKRACPACHGVLAEPKPLRRLQCPVCRRALIRRRSLPETVCPNCQGGPFRKLSNLPTLRICPSCQGAPLKFQRRGLTRRNLSATCSDCGTIVTEEDGRLRDTSHDVVMSTPEWLAELRRASEFHFCEACSAQFDVEMDGRWRQVRPHPTRWMVLYPDEWARVAAGLSPGSGNAACESCAAEFYLDDDRLTLLDAQEDSFGFVNDYLGRILGIDQVRWVAVGKESSHAGLTCENCATEFDRDGMYYRLVRSPSRRMAAVTGAPRTMEDWHRIAGGLPTIDKESEVEADLDRALRAAYRSGEISFDSEGVVAWRGDAVLNRESKGKLVIRDGEVSFGGRFRRNKLPVDAIASAHGRGADLTLQFTGERESNHFRIEPVQLTAELRSGARSITLDAADLAHRLGAR